MEEGKILKWLKHVGDAIAAGEVIAEVETDKADMELEAAEAGAERHPGSRRRERAGRGGDRGRRRQRQRDKRRRSRRRRVRCARKAATRHRAPQTPAAGYGRGAARAETGSEEQRHRPASASGTAARRARKVSAAARALAAERGIDLAGIAEDRARRSHRQRGRGSGEREDGAASRRRVELLATVKRRSPNGTSSPRCGSRSRGA